MTFTIEELKALYELLDQLSGGNSEYIFRWDGTDSLDDTTTRAAAKLFKAVGADVPPECK